MHVIQTVSTANLIEHYSELTMNMKTSLSSLNDVFTNSTHTQTPTYIGKCGWHLLLF